MRVRGGYLVGDRLVAVDARVPAAELNRRALDHLPATTSDRRASCAGDRARSSPSAEMPTRAGRCLLGAIDTARLAP
jgi:hypothetical protein